MVSKRLQSWSEVEDKSLQACVSRYGLFSWGRIASVLPGRSANDCKARYQFLSTQTTVDWTKEQEDELLETHSRFPNQWATISKVMRLPIGSCQTKYSELMENRGLRVEFERDVLPELMDSIKEGEDDTLIHEDVISRISVSSSGAKRRKHRMQQLSLTKRLVKQQAKRMASVGTVEDEKVSLLNQLLGEKHAEKHKDLAMKQQKLNDDDEDLFDLVIDDTAPQKEQKSKKRNVSHLFKSSSTNISRLAKKVAQNTKTHKKSTAVDLVRAEIEKNGEAVAQRILVNVQNLRKRREDVQRRYYDDCCKRFNTALNRAYSNLK
ncbi:hypothetical protein PCE1_000551 [Barthelona sp. PCE]